MMRPEALGWQAWALLSAFFAALTAIFAKLGVADIDSDFATFIRTVVVLVVLGVLCAATGQMRDPTTIPARSYLMLLLSGLATGASWLCYFRALKVGQAAEVAPLDKLSIVLVAIFAVGFLGERLPWQGWTGIAMIAGGAALIAYRP